jgi:hypothetical protein
VTGEDLGERRPADVARADEEQAKGVGPLFTPVPTHSSIFHDHTTTTSIAEVG